jgi:hypothetical protein
MPLSESAADASAGDVPAEDFFFGARVRWSTVM